LDFNDHRRAELRDAAILEGETAKALGVTASPDENDTLALEALVNALSKLLFLLADADPSEGAPEADLPKKLAFELGTLEGAETEERKFLDDAETRCDE